VALVAFVSARSPGLTTAVLALAAVWPGPRQACVAELDPAGGVLACRQAFHEEPGLITLAADANHHLDSQRVLSHFRRLADGTPVLPAPPSPDRTAASLEALNRVHLGFRLAALAGFDVLADCGRIDTRSPALPVLDAAATVVFVVRAEREDVIGLQYRLGALQVTNPTLRGGIVAVGTPQQRAEACSVFSLPILGGLDIDTKGAAALNEGNPQPRSRLLRSATQTALRIAETLPAARPADAPQPEPTNVADQPANHHTVKHDTVKHDTVSSQLPPVRRPYATNPPASNGNGWSAR
jgi:hypothetical protein